MNSVDQAAALAVLSDSVDTLVDTAARVGQEVAEEVDETLHADSDEFGTPLHIFNALNEEFHFTLDAAATSTNALLPNYITAEEDALKQDWGTFNRAVPYSPDNPIPVTVRPGAKNVVFCNPPYSRGFVPAFVRKAYDESLKGVTSVLLIPTRTEQNWFHDIVLPYAEIRFVRGRIKFVGGKTTARQTHMIVIFPKRRNPHVTFLGRQPNGATMVLEPRCTP